MAHRKPVSEDASASFEDLVPLTQPILLHLFDQMAGLRGGPGLSGTLHSWGRGREASIRNQSTFDHVSPLMPKIRLQPEPQDFISSKKHASKSIKRKHSHCTFPVGQYPVDLSTHSHCDCQVLQEWNGLPICDC